MRTEPGEDDDDTPEREAPVTAAVVTCHRHPDSNARLWNECSLCQGERNRQVTTAIAHELANFKGAVSAGDREGERHAVKQLRALGVGRDHLEMLSKLILSGGGAGPARRARKADL